jgi:diguanylate cyclase (GGDEF)-like protein
MKKILISPIFILLTFNSICAFYITPIFATPYLESGQNEFKQDKEQATSDISPTIKPSGLLKNEEPLPVNARILSLLALLKEQPQDNLSKVENILPQLKAIDETFNAAENYLIFFIEGFIEHAAHRDEEAISVFEKTLPLRKNIPKKQLYLPEFSETNLILAKSFSNIGDFKQAFEYKEKYIIDGDRYFYAIRDEKIAELQKTYATDHKLKQNELLVNQNKIESLKIKDAENKKFVQQRNIAILVITVVIFLLFLLKQLKIRKQLKYLAKTDSLTNLYNRRTLFEQGEHLVGTAITEQQPLSVILLDIDFFKNVNDTYGHDVGDDVIKAIAQLGSETMRSRDVFARLGGEEFAGILPGVTCAEAKAIAERLREKVENMELSSLKIEQQVTVSIGVACLDFISPDFDELLNAADIAMYFAKANGRNRVCLYNENIEQ